MRNKLTDLRDHLFAALEGLADEEKPMDIERARAIAEVSQVVINSAKLELEVVKVYEGRVRGSDFVPVEPIDQVQGPQRPALRGAR